MKLQRQREEEDEEKSLPLLSVYFRVFRFPCPRKFRKVGKPNFLMIQYYMCSSPKDWYSTVNEKKQKKAQNCRKKNLFKGKQ